MTQIRTQRDTLQNITQQICQGSELHFFFFLIYFLLFLSAIKTPQFGTIAFLAVGFYLFYSTE